MDNATILDGIVKGIGQILLTKNKRRYAWAIFNAYLFGLQTGKVAIYKVFEHEARNCKKWSTIMERAILFGDDNVWKLLNDGVVTNHIINKAKALIASVLHGGGIFEGRKRKKVVKEIVAYIENAMKSGEIAKVRTAGVLLLYLKTYVSVSIVKGNTPEVSYEWLNEMRKAVEIIVKVWQEKKGVNRRDDVLLFRLTKKPKYLSNIGKVKKPQYWFVWV